MKIKRLLAFYIDLMAAVLFALLINGILSLLNVKVITPMVGILAIAWVICKDCLNGISIGKRFLGIQVIDIATNQVASPQQSVVRNLFYFLSIFDMLFMFTDSKNARLGDRIAHTEVVLRTIPLPKVKWSQVALSIGYVLCGVIVMEIFYYSRASAFGLL